MKWFGDNIQTANWLNSLKGTVARYSAYHIDCETFTNFNFSMCASRLQEKLNVNNARGVHDCKLEIA